MQRIKLLLPKSAFYVLRHRDFRLLIIGLFISRIGSEMQVMAINWHVYLLTGSAISLGLIGLARFLPVVCFGLLGGAVADLYDRRIIMIISQCVMVFTTFVLMLFTVFHMISPVLIYIILAISSVASAFDAPARQALTPLLVPKNEFVKAVGLNSIMWQTAVVLGPSIGGFIIAYVGISAVYFINTLSFISVIGALFMMSPHRGEISAKLELNTAHIKEGLSFVKNTPLIWSTMLLDFFATFFSSGTILLPIFAKDILKVGPQGLGLLYAAPAIGAVVTGFIVSSYHNIKNQGRLLLIAVCFYGFSTILFGISRSFYLSLFFLSLSGAGDVISTIIRNTVRQLGTPDYIRGRMISINMLFYMGGPQLGEVEAGFVAGLVNTPFAVITGGIATIVATLLVAYAVPQLRKYQGHEHLEIV